MADLVTRAQLEACIGADTVRRMIDHNGDGVPDKPSLDLICAHASSKVRGALPGYDPTDLTPENAVLATELSRLALNAALATTVMWYPGVTSFRWDELMGQVDKELEMVRKGQANLGSRTTPEEADHSATVVSSATGASDYDYWA